MSSLPSRLGAAPASWASRPLLFLMVGTDVGFLLYWLVTALHALPPAWLFKDYDNPILTAWNWSFLPLDLVVSVTGLRAYASIRAARPDAYLWTVMSLVATSTSGLMAISFWVMRRDFDLGWWIPNLFLLVYPVPFLRRILASKPSA